MIETYTDNHHNGRVFVIVVNTETVEGMRTVRVLGLVSGSTVRARNVGRDFVAGLRNILGGELPEYTELLQESRNEAVDRMLEHARRLGANAVLGLRFATTSVAAGASEVLVYGTAAVVEPAR